MAQKSKWPPSTVLRAAVDVTKAATSALDHSELDGLWKNFISKKEYFLSPESLEAAENLCRVGLDHRHKYRHPDHAGAVRIVMATNLLLVLGDKGDYTSVKGLRDHLLQGLLTHGKLTFGGAITEVIGHKIFC